MFSTAVSPAQTQFLLGKTYYDAAQFSEAEQFFLKAMELDPQLPNVQLELAKVYLSQRRTDDASAQLRRILLRSPRDADANYFLGGALVQDGKYREGIPFLEKAREVNARFLGRLFLPGQGHVATEAPRRSGAAAPAGCRTQSARSFHLITSWAKRSRRWVASRRRRPRSCKVRELRAEALDREVDSTRSVAGIR